MNDERILAMKAVIDAARAQTANAESQCNDPGCEPWRSRGLRCPECPLDWGIVDALITLDNLTGDK